ncbi:molybdate ABC transporter substrate-binding protein [Undibacterium sp. RTI2.1]|uniref:molybdate ABC transporter substrate-binding protein n=1 Tax=unclassified Undibacterium TaxID=2630295 RepID=UPI002AB3CFE8|nr:MULTISPECIES: molybdate ABC transporter substrate-binding protein [unclassified Undibacterium]MDY7539890.1 molybdate ABC transporter substrate-binding protein [Undibacterium sp. 5I1]MEB0033113.1 molybdate ABC transporter substrate-binding protein [Undibacterium sp. RTI2.1]MEB0118919.1 molybdate ABC transporter substrate-binding protein [Undibacterium sp. RTI2.2]MEB0233165.1 molybdate ABC transporter substrate-binding protein [Undibacterium sp. 10I3]MEB0257195.1 molybdate ABC transporter sub
MQARKFTQLLSFIVAIAVSSAAGAGEITVSAAASLTNAFKEIAQNYQAQYPDAKVLLNFGASGALLQQIAKGAPVDVFASADQETMDTAEKQGLVVANERRDFVGNTLVLILPLDSKVSIKRLNDLNQAGIKRIAIGAPASVPVGRYTMQALEAAKLWPALESKTINTQNVRQSLDYVARGEVDAGFVYATDAAIMKDKVKVVMEVPLTMSISYPVAKLKDSAHIEEAKRFIGFLFLPQSQAVLSQYGFQKP